MKYNPHNYQLKAIDFIMEKPNCGLFLDMGLGKTSATLTAIDLLLRSMEVLKPLIIAPKYVCEHTWPEEVGKWDHTKHLTYSRIIGNEKQRVKALMQPADFYLISRDNIDWLVKYLLKLPGKRWPFDMIVIDELSSFKNNESLRFKALKKCVRQAVRVVGLTGTPVPNGLMDLWSQMYLLDQGERLGRTITRYRYDYFRKNPYSFGYDILPGAHDIIQDKIKDICISMTAKDYLELPERLDIVRHIELDNMDAYNQFKKEETLLLLNGDDITPLSAAAMYNKLLQFSNGAVYDDVKNYHIVDDTKLLTLKEDVESLNGEPVIVFYQFKSDLERLKAAIPVGKHLNGAEIIEDWNKGKIPVMFAHAASVGHGLNLQHGGSVMMWYGVPWSLELWLQAIKRLDRQGQKKTVRNFIYIAKGTVDEIVLDRLNDKTVTQENLIDALKVHLS